MKKILIALIALTLSQSLISQSGEELNSRGIELARKGKIDEALTVFEKAIELYPNIPAPYTNRGNIYRMRKDYDLAIRDYSKSLELYPDNLNVRYARARTYVLIEDFDMAISDYSKIIEEESSFTNIFFDRAYAYIRLEDYDKAKLDLESQLKMTPEDFDSLVNLIQVKKELELFDEALADYKKIAAKFPNHPNRHIFYNNWASLYKEMDKPNEALTTINQALKFKKKYDLGLFNRANIYLKLEDKKKACKDYKKALKLNLLQNPHFEADEDFETLKKTCD